MAEEALVQRPGDLGELPEGGDESERLEAERDIEGGVGHEFPRRAPHEQRRIQHGGRARVYVLPG